jgi:hypothetical protein
MSGNDPSPGEDFVGRKKHLGSLLLPFYHRGATWGDFGRFLEVFFRGDLHVRKGGHLLFHEQKCRHNSGGKHFSALDNSRKFPQEYPMFNAVRYTRPCISFGKGEVGKNPGFIVFDTVLKAKAFLESINKGEKIENSAQDTGSSYGSDDQDDLSEMSTEDEEDMLDYVDSGEVRDLSNDLLGIADSDSQDTDYGSVIAAEDLEAIMKPFAESEERASRAHPSLEADPPIQSQEGDFRPQDVSFSKGPGNSRSSTKVRAATLAYLRGFSREPSRLREETRRLCEDSTLCVLHLCGCGMPFEHNGTLVPGCCEWSHLKLGTLEENGRHKTWHTAMGMSDAADYPALCDIVHRGKDGDGLF